jgi:hypothetical protein
MIKLATANENFAGRMAYEYIPSSVKYCPNYYTKMSDIKNSKDGACICFFEKNTIWDRSYYILLPEGIVSYVDVKTKHWVYTFRGEKYPLLLEKINWPVVELEEIFT